MNSSVTTALQPIVLDYSGDVEIKVKAIYVTDDVDEMVPDSVVVTTLFHMEEPLPVAIEKEEEEEEEVVVVEKDEPKFGIYYGGQDTSNLLIANSAKRAEMRRAKKEELILKQKENEERQKMERRAKRDALLQHGKVRKGSIPGLSTGNDAGDGGFAEAVKDAGKKKDGGRTKLDIVRNLRSR